MKRLIHALLLMTFLFSILSSCNEKKKAETHAAHQDEYTCPMHPEIIRNAPGSCPICGMDLVKKEAGSAAVAEDVELETLLRPANTFVVSSVPVTALEQREEDVELNVVGTVAYDNRQSGAISSRVAGRIEKLYIRYRFQPVKKGRRVMDIYSPRLVTAQQNLLFLLKNDPGNVSLINAAKDRLLLLGMSSAQVQQVVRSKRPQYSVPVFSAYSGFVTDLASSASVGSSDGMGTGAANNQPASNQPVQTREGMYVQSGQAVFTVYDPKRAWILLDVFPELQTAMRVGYAVRIVPETAPSKNFRATISYIEPIFRNGSKTVSARVYFNNASMQLPIGSRVRATVFSSPKIASWLPKEAVLSLGRDKIVFKKEGEGFRAHKIAAGIEVNNYIQVTGGLQPADSVARNAQFLVDNEAFIKAEGK